MTNSRRTSRGPAVEKHCCRAQQRLLLMKILSRFGVTRSFVKFCLKYWDLFGTYFQNILRCVMFELIETRVENDEDEYLIFQSFKIFIAKNWKPGAMPFNQSYPITATAMLEERNEFLNSLNIQRNSKYFRWKNGQTRGSIFHIGHVPFLGGAASFLRGRYWVLDVRFPMHIPINRWSLSVSLGTIRFNFKNLTFCPKSVLHVASLTGF